MTIAPSMAHAGVLGTALMFRNSARFSVSICSMFGCSVGEKRVSRTMLDYLVNLVGRLGHWGYLAIFLGAMLESAAFLGLLVPGEALVLVAGFFAAQGLLDIGDLILLVAIGAIIGDSIGYEMGFRTGRPALERYG